MGGLIPENKHEFNQKSFDEQLYATYREAAEARIQAERNGGSILLNRFLIIGGLIALTAVETCNCSRAKKPAVPAPVHNAVMPNAFGAPVSFDTATVLTL